MSQPLPTGDFQWQPPEQFSEEKIKNIDPKGATGYFFSGKFFFSEKLL